MPKKNLSLVKRSSNRSVPRPLLTPPESTTYEPPTPSPLRDKVLWNHSALDSFSKLYVPSGQMDLEWQPTTAAVFKILFSFRVSAAMWSSVSDCDEVYNYWEPLHLFLYGTGFQTWEYSPVYAIRSYLYILLHYGPAKVLQRIFFANKVGVFITMRCVLGLFNVAAEIAMYKALCSRFGNGIARLYIALTTLSCGMFIASCAFLPSSFSMSANLFAMAAYINEDWFMAISFTALSALVSWPFAAVLGLPIVLEMLIVRPRELALTFINYALMAGTAISATLILVDSYYFGRLVLAPVNIVLYNVFSSHGPNLYGVEDVKYYIKNLLLNWNVVIILFPLAIPLAGLTYVRTRSSPQLGHPVAREMTFFYWKRLLPIIFIFMSVMLWFAIFFWQPHKEERFLFPVYPLLAILAAVTLDALPRIGVHLLGGGTRGFFQACVIGWLLIFSVLSVSRSAALYRNFSAPMEVFKGLNEHLLNYNNRNNSFIAQKAGAQVDRQLKTNNCTISYTSLYMRLVIYFGRDILGGGLRNFHFMSFYMNNTVVHVCIGKEWYRFPSSFFLPTNIRTRQNQMFTTELNFIKSKFTGLLPKPYMKGSLPEITRVIPTEMNDLNREEMSRYLDIEQCDFLVDLETPDSTVEEPNFAEETSIWRSVVKKRFLLSSYSHPVYRSFYIPFITGSNVIFGNYHLLERIHRRADDDAADARSAAAAAAS